jgi:hypothetical protein
MGSEVVGGMRHQDGAEVGGATVTSMGTNRPGVAGRMGCAGSTSECLGRALAIVRECRGAVIASNGGRADAVIHELGRMVAHEAAAEER